MNVILDEEYKKDLINHFSSAIKQVQMEQLAKQSVGDGPESQHIITNDSPSGQILCSSLEMIFMHGLKERKSGYWEVVRYFCRNDVIQIIKRLKHVKTDFGRGRAWIFIALNENEFEGYLQSFVMDLQHMQKYYQGYAMLCSSQVSVLQTLISGLEYVKFNLHPDVPHLDFRILNTTTSTKKIAPYSGGATHVVDKNRGSVVHIDATPLTELASKGKERASSFLKDHFRRENTNELNVAKMPMKVIADHSIRQIATAESVGGCEKCAKRNALICLCVEKDANTIPNMKQGDENVAANGCILNETDHTADRVPFNSPASPQGIPERFNPFDKDAGYSGEYVILESIKKESFKRFDKHVAISDTPIEVVHKPRKKPRSKRRISDSGSESSAKSEERAIPHEIIYSPMLDADDPDSMFTGADPDVNVTNLMRFMKKMSQPRHVDSSRHEHTSDRYKSSEVGEEPNHPATSLMGNAGMGGAPGTDTYETKIEPESSTLDGRTNVDSNEKCNTAEFPSSSVQEYNMCNITDHTEHHMQDQKNSVVTLNSDVETATNGNEASNMTAVRTCDGETEIPTEKVERPLPMENVSSSVATATKGCHSIDLPNVRTCDKECDESEASSIYEPEIANADVAQVEEMVSGDDLGENNIYEGGVSSATPDSVMSSVQPLMADEQIPEPVSIAAINAQDKENDGLVDSLSSNDLTTNSHRPSLDVGVRNPNSGVTQVLTQHEQMENVCGVVDSMEKIPESHTVPEMEVLENLTINDCDHEADHGTSKHNQRLQPTDGQSNRKVLKDEALSPIFFHETFSIPDSVSVPCNSEETTSANSKNDFSEDDCLDGTVSKGQDEEALHPSVVNVDNNLRLYLLIEILEDESETIIKLFHLSTGHSEGCWAALYLLFTDCFIYFLRNGDGKSPFQVEHLVSYEDLDYISTAYCSQAMQFVFYEEKPNPTKGASANRRKLRTKMTLDTADEHLTDIVITSLSSAFALFAKQRGVVKVCPPVFHNSKDHELLLRKYVQSEGLSGEIDLYLLVYWEDPDSVAGEDLANVTKEGPLDCKIRSFWGATWKPAYFVLSSGILYQYKSKETDKPDAIYDLKENKCAGCKRARSNSSTPSLEFEVIFQDETLTLRGQTDAEVTGWLQHLCLTVALKQAPDQKCPPDDKNLRSLTHDALVPCSLVLSCETMLLFHEDPLTGFCRTLAKAGHDDFASVHFDRERNACEIAITNSAKWAVFFPHAKSMDTFDDLVNKFSRAPMTGSVVDQNLLSHFEEGRFLLDNRWTRPDNLLKGRNEKDEYAFI